MSQNSSCDSSITMTLSVTRTKHDASYNPLTCRCCALNGGGGKAGAHRAHGALQHRPAEHPALRVSQKGRRTRVMQAYQTKLFSKTESAMRGQI